MLKVNPLPHQVSIIDYMLPYDQFALIADCGIGKSYIMLNVIEKKNYKKVLIVAPKSVMENAWGEDIPAFTDFSHSIIWDKKFNKRSSLLGDQRIHIINYDVLDRMYLDLAQQKYDCIILDESTFIKTHSSKRCKAALKLGRLIKHRYILTGTPGFQVSKYWSQWSFIDPAIWNNMNFYKFREKYFFKIDMGGISTYKFNRIFTEEINKRLYIKGIRILKDEVQSYLPKRNFIIRLLDMPKDAKKYYDTFSEHGVVDDLYSFFSISQRMKLRQMANGAVINEQKGIEKKIIHIHDSKYKEVMRILEDDIEDQVIIWANFDEEFIKLHELTGFPMICGGVNYINTIKDFKDGKIKGVIAHPKSVAHGITWTKCHKNIFFGVTDDLEYFQQSLDRTHRHGQIFPVDYYIILMKGTIDELIWKSHKKNKDLESDLSSSNILSSMKLRQLIALGVI